MKEFLFRILFVGMILSVFSACSDDKGDDPIPPKEPVPSLVGYRIKMQISQDILSAADVTLLYIDENGVQQQESILGTTIEKTIITDSFDKTLGYSIKLNEKSTTGIQTEKCRVEWADYSTFMIVDDSGKMMKTHSVPSSTYGMTIATSDMSTWLSNHATMRDVAYKTADDNRDFVTATIQWK